MTDHKALNQIDAPRGKENCEYCHGQGFTMVSAPFGGDGYIYSKPMTCQCVRSPAVELQFYNPAADEVVALRAELARLSAQRCETCAFKEDKLSAALNGQILCGRTRTVETMPHGCTAHQPKEGK